MQPARTGTREARIGTRPPSPIGAGHLRDAGLPLTMVPRLALLGGLLALAPGVVGCVPKNMDKPVAQSTQSAQSSSTAAGKSLHMAALHGDVAAVQGHIDAGAEKKSQSSDGASKP